jgi:hypothetical protein
MVVRARLEIARTQKKARQKMTASLGLRPRTRVPGFRRRSLLVLGLALSLGAAGCKSSAAPATAPPDAGLGTPDAGMPRSSDPVTVADLATAGLPVFTDATASQPIAIVSTELGPTPLRLLQDQAAALSDEAAAGQGVLGADLDAPAVLPAGMPSASYFIAGYVSAAGTPGAALAHRIMGDQDFRHAPTLVYPNVVLMLFAADAARYANALGPQAADGPTTGALSVPIPMGLCSDAQSFIDMTISAFFDALGHLESPMVPKSGVGIIDFFGRGLQAAFDLATGVVNGLIDGGRFIVIAGIKKATQPVLDAIATVAGTAALASTVVAVLRPWTVVVTADPPQTRRAVTPEAGLPGSIQAVVKLPDGLDTWPPLLVDCAKVSGVTLPPLKPVGAPVVWTLKQAPSPLVIQDPAAKTALDDDAQATLGYLTTAESAKDARGDALEGKVDADISITRKEISDLQKTVSDLIFSQIPSLLSPYLTPLLKPVVDAVLQLPVTLLATHGTAHLPVTYHECTSGDCCDNGKIACGDMCFDVSADPVNCGACGVACAGDETCAGGSCVPNPKPKTCTPACPTGQTCQGGVCANTAIVASCTAGGGDTGRFCADFTGSIWTLALTKSSCVTGVWSASACPTANRFGSCALGGTSPGAYIDRLYPGDPNPMCNTCQTDADCSDTHPCVGGCCDDRQTAAEAKSTCTCATAGDPDCPVWTPN